MMADIVKYEQFYTTQPKDFYAAQMKAKGLRHVWFKRRQIMARRLVERYFERGLVLDIGCGNCVWNNVNIPTLGIDISEAMLKYNISSVRSFSPLKADISYGLPVKDSSIDIVVATEVLEHFANYSFLIKEIKRVLKVGGVVVGSVPYALFPGIWGVLFPIWCTYKGLRYNDKYYLNRCGHKVKFSTKRIAKSLDGFRVLRMDTIGLLTIFFVARKTSNDEVT